VPDWEADAAGAEAEAVLERLPVEEAPLEAPEPDEAEEEAPEEAAEEETPEEAAEVARAAAAV
jgi:hypothetical protein